MACECYYCVKHREIAKAKRERNVEALSKLAIELGGRAICAEDDGDYYRCILDGSWPSAIEILEKALKTAKDK